MHGDRHGRGLRADGDRRRRPSDGFRVMSRRRFAQLVEDALATLPEPLLEAVAEADVRVEDVPPEPPVAAPEIPLAAFAPARRGRPAQLVVYRRAVEARAVGRADLLELLRAAAGSEIARALGLGDAFDDDLWGD